MQGSCSGVDGFFVLVGGFVFHRTFDGLGADVRAVEDLLQLPDGVVGEHDGRRTAEMDAEGLY